MRMLARYDEDHGEFEVDLWKRGKGFSLRRSAATLGRHRSPQSRSADGKSLRMTSEARSSNGGPCAKTAR